MDELLSNCNIHQVIEVRELVLDHVFLADPYKISEMCRIKPSPNMLPDNFYLLTVFLYFGIMNHYTLCDNWFSFDLVYIKHNTE